MFSHHVKYRWYTWEHDVIERTHISLTGFLKWLKNQFLDELRHLRRTCSDLGTRVFDEANLVLVVTFLFRRFGRIILKKEDKWITQKVLKRSGFSPSRAFHQKSRIYRSPSGSLENWFFVGLYWTSNPAVVEWRGKSPIFFAKLLGCVDTPEKLL